MTDSNMYFFLKTLYAGCSSGYITCWDKETKHTEFFDVTHLEEASEHAREAAQQKDIYFGVGLRGNPLPNNQRGTEADISVLPGVFADIDIAGSNHRSRRRYPDSLGTVQQVLRSMTAPAPSIVVHTGGGLHCYWLFEEPWSLEEDESREQAKTLLQNFQKCLRRAFCEQGFDMDITADLARVLRLPDTSNYKQAPPVPVRIISEKEHVKRYSISQLEQWVTAHAIKDKTGFGIVASNGAMENKQVGAAELLIRFCSFIQYCRDHATQLSEPEWHAMVANMALTKNGKEEIHRLSQPYPGYSYNETQQKIDRAIGAEKPHSCQYIQRDLGFTGCPAGGCPVQAPIGWATSHIGKAVETIDNALQQTHDGDIYDQQIIGALALLHNEAPVQYGYYKTECLQKWKRTVSKSDLESLVKEKAAKIRYAINQARMEGEVALLQEQLKYSMVFPKGYIIKDGNIWLCHDDKTEHISYQVIAISKKYKGDITFIELIFQEKGHWKTMLVEANCIASRTDIVRLASQGLQVDSELARGLVSYLSAFNAANCDIPVVSITKHYGWQNDSEFLPGASLKMLLVDAGNIRKIEPLGDLDSWRKQITPMRMYPVARLVLAASFAAPLLERLGIRSFIVHIFGPSQSGKTAAMVGAGSIWLPRHEIFTNFNATSVGIEFTLGYLKNLPVLIDERQIMQKVANLDYLVYMIGEGAGRTRGTRTGQVALPPKWKTIIITSGEHPLSSSQSNEGVKTRALEVYAEKVIPDSPYASSLHNIGDTCYGHAGPAFIARLISYSNLQNDYENRLTEIRSEFANLPESYYAYLAVLSLADILSSQWIFEVQEQIALQESNNMIQEIAGIIGTREENNEAKRAFEMIIDWVYQNRYHFDDYTSDSQYGIDMNDDIEYGTINNGSERYGFIKDDGVYVIPTTLEKFLGEHHLSMERLKRDFAQNKRLITAKDGGAISYTISAKPPVKGEAHRRMYKLNIKMKEDRNNLNDGLATIHPSAILQKEEAMSEDIRIQ